MNNNIYVTIKQLPVVNKTLLFKLEEEKDLKVELPKS